MKLMKHVSDNFTQKRISPLKVAISERSKTGNFHNTHRTGTASHFWGWVLCWRVVRPETRTICLMKTHFLIQKILICSENYWHETGND